MTAQLEERDRQYETTEETDATIVEMVEMEEPIMQEMHTMDAKETDVMDGTITGVLTIPLVTSNNLQGLPPSARR